MAASAPKIRPALPAAVIRSAPFFEGAVVFVSEPVGFKSVSVPVSVLVGTEFVGVKRVAVVLKEDAVVVACRIENCPDWARMELRSSVSLTKLTWKPLPVGYPVLGGLTVNDPRVPSTSAARTCW